MLASTLEERERKLATTLAELARLQKECETAKRVIDYKFAECDHLLSLIDPDEYPPAIYSIHNAAIEECVTVVESLRSECDGANRRHSNKIILAIRALKKEIS